MKIYAYYKGDKFNLNHPNTNLDKYVDAVWLDIQGKELTINYLKDVDVSKINPETNMYLQIFDKHGIVTEGYMLRMELSNRCNNHITYKLKHANCYLEFDDDDDNLEIYGE